MTDDDVPERDALYELRRLGTELGMPGEVRPEDHGISLETADQFVARMRATQLDTGTELPTPHFDRRRRWRGLQIAAVAAVAVGVAIAAIFTPWSHPSALADTPPILSYQFAPATNIAFAPGKDARPDLLALSAAAASSKSISENGPVQYVQTDNWFVSREDSEKVSTSELVPTVVQSWLAPDGSQTIVETTGRRLRVDGRGLTPAPRSSSARADQEFPPGSADAKRIANLGTTSTAVRRELIQTAGCERDASSTSRAQCLYQEITGLFNQYVIPPKVASLFWQLLADEPGFRSLGSVTDRAGRPGIGISVISSDAPEFRSVLVISPSTGQLLGTEVILIKTNTELGLKAPAINSFSAILAAEYMPTRPEAR